MKLKSLLGLLVAGNFTGHLEQAGEAGDFVNTKVESKIAPKGLIPFYVPVSDTFLSEYPFSSEKLKLPDKNSNVQIEPEIFLNCEIEYDSNKLVCNIIPKSFGVFNDASIRNKETPKISYKKNWGEASQGISDKLIEIDKFAPGGILDNYKLVSFLKRNEKVKQYGEDSFVKTYSYFHEKLLSWTVRKMNNQKDEGPFKKLTTQQN